MTMASSSDTVPSLYIDMTSETVADTLLAGGLARLVEQLYGTAAHRVTIHDEGPCYKIELTPPLKIEAIQAVDDVHLIKPLMTAGKQEKALRLFSCGRLTHGKGHQDLIQAAEILRRRGIDARLAIAGEDDAGGAGYRSVLEARVARGTPAGATALLGAVSEERVRDELSRAHVFALASLTEALGVATMEAMAMRVPVVVTGVGGVPELVDDGVNGLLVSPARPEAMADAIEAVARDPERARRLGEAGRRKVEAGFDSGRSAEVLARHLLAR